MPKLIKQVELWGLEKINSSTHHGDGDGAQFLPLLFCYGEPFLCSFCYCCCCFTVGHVELALTRKVNNNMKEINKEKKRNIERKKERKKGASVIEARAFSLVMFCFLFFSFTQQILRSSCLTAFFLFFFCSSQN